jgi:hypothetical protein
LVERRLGKNIFTFVCLVAERITTEARMAYKNTEKRIPLRPLGH